MFRDPLDAPPLEGPGGVLATGADMPGEGAANAAMEPPSRLP